ncbi:hypothetical protein CCHR01_05904 [Colletotrichum chrysophilum]|uniref:Uncharacterized protein n=1 Tax=Colletotrichum chrysophilum TaxID=1836956 RepID=A0AAD9ANA6_9PEZI|nr:hypothetical protein CCHR01_05904 [Colletotrichum chrysophilum]
MEGRKAGSDKRRKVWLQAMNDEWAGGQWTERWAVDGGGQWQALVLAGSACMGKERARARPKPSFLHWLKCWHLPEVYSARPVKSRLSFDGADVRRNPDMRASFAFRLLPLLCRWEGSCKHWRCGRAGAGAGAGAGASTSVLPSTCLDAPFSHGIYG